jgi:hypothetical protein
MTNPKESFAVTLKRVLRRIYIGKSERIGARQIVRLLFLLGFTISLAATPFQAREVQDSTVTAAPSATPTPSETLGDQEDLQISEELISQQAELDYNLGKVKSGFLPKELIQFKAVSDDLKSFEIAVRKSQIDKVQELCVELKKTDESLVPIHQRINNMNIIPEKYDQYWGLGSFFLFNGNLQCGKVNSSTVGLLESKKINFYYGRALFYFDKILTEGTANKLPDQERLDKALLKESVAEEDAFFAEVDARVKPYYEKNAGFSQEDIVVLSNFRSQLTNYINSVKTTNLVTIAIACESVASNYVSLRETSSSSTVYESYLDNMKGFIYSGITDCQKGFKKNRINLLISADSDFKSALTFLDALVQFSKQLK